MPYQKWSLRFYSLNPTIRSIITIYCDEAFLKRGACWSEVRIESRKLEWLNEAFLKRSAWWSAVRTKSKKLEWLESNIPSFFDALVGKIAEHISTNAISLTTIKTYSTMTSVHQKWLRVLWILCANLQKKDLGTTSYSSRMLHQAKQ